MDFYTTQHLRTIFKVSHQTIKNWADEFASYLSPTANPEAGKKRLYTTEDVQVFALVKDYRQRGYTYEDVHTALKTGQRGDIPFEASDIVSTVPP